MGICKEHIRPNSDEKIATEIRMLGRCHVEEGIVLMQHTGHARGKES